MSSARRRPGDIPGILLYSEIFQVTGPIRRTAALLAGNGFIVAVPEIYHEYEAAGTALAYDSAGADRGNALKTTKPLDAYDADARAVLQYLAAHPASTGKLGVHGHLHRRPSRLPRRDESRGPRDRLLLRHRHPQARPRRGDERQHARPHPRAARRDADDLGPAGSARPVRGPADSSTTPWKPPARTFQWHEVNGAHAFLRDEGPRYNPVLAQQCYGLAMEMFKRRLGEGDRLLEQAVGTNAAR